MRYIQNQINSGQRPCTALVLSRHEWDGLQNQIVKKHRQQERNEERAIQEKLKRDRSKKMTKDWPNTLASMQKQREKQIMEATKTAEDQKVKEYNAILEKRAKEKEEIIENAKKIVYERNETSRRITSGLILSAILDERAKQVRMKQVEREKLYAQAQEEACVSRQMAQAYQQEMGMEKTKHLQQMQRNKHILDQQMVEILHNRQLEWNHKMQEREDADNIGKELAMIKAKDMEESIQRKKKLKEDQEKWAAVDAEYKQQRSLQDQEQAEMNAIYQLVRDKLEAQRSEVEKKVKEEVRERRAKVPAEHLPQPEDRKKDEELLKRALQERAEQLERELEERNKKKERLRQELQEYEREAVRAAEKDAKRRLETERLAMLQRLALEDADRTWRTAQAEEKRASQKAVRNALLQQWEEREKFERETRWDDLTVFYKTRTEENDTLLRYCDEIKKAAAETGRPMYPVLAAIESVKKSAGLRDEKRKVPFLQSRVPIRSIAAYETPQ